MKEEDQEIEDLGPEEYEAFLGWHGRKLLSIEGKSKAIKCLEMVARRRWKQKNQGHDFGRG